ncbi:MAG: hypothetical protein NVSMB65_05950 [Chloroflexota bacterium]
MHRAGNVLVDDLGTTEYDVVLIANLAHHFDDATNRALQRRIARALRPGGCSVVLDLLRPPSGKVDQVGALAGFYFAVTSASGTWSAVEIADWQREARLLPRKPIMLLTSPGLGLQAAVKPSAYPRRPTRAPARYPCDGGDGARRTAPGRDGSGREG